MKIILDYDNDQIRIGHNKYFENSLGIGIINMKVKNIPEFKSVLMEILNMLNAEDQEQPSISLECQDEGRISIIEEY
jgi:hypothetical protein